jgi:hypothetical protein
MTGSDHTNLEWSSTMIRNAVSAVSFPNLFDIVACAAPDVAHARVSGSAIGSDDSEVPLQISDLPVLAMSVVDDDQPQPPAGLA